MSDMNCNRPNQSKKQGVHFPIIRVCGRNKPYSEIECREGIEHILRALDNDKNTLFYYIEVNGVDQLQPWSDAPFKKWRYNFEGMIRKMTTDNEPTKGQ